jgi:uncharacterized membrane protein YphA (DoxX/SURF4 family)
MNPLRFAGRALLASYFIGHGVAVLRDPDATAADAEPVLARVQDLSARFLPESVQRFIPSGPRAWARIHGVTEIVGAGLMATGLARRAGAVVLATSQVFRVAAGNPSDRSAGGPVSPELGRDLALLGACVIEAFDTQGRPSVVWRLGEGRREIARRVAEALD